MRVVGGQGVQRRPTNKPPTIEDALPQIVGAVEGQKVTELVAFEAKHPLLNMFLSSLKALWRSSLLHSVHCTVGVLNHLATCMAAARRDVSTSESES